MKADNVTLNSVLFDKVVLALITGAATRQSDSRIADIDALLKHAEEITRKFQQYGVVNY